MGYYEWNQLDQSSQRASSAIYQVTSGQYLFLEKEKSTAVYVRLSQAKVTWQEQQVHVDMKKLPF